MIDRLRQKLFGKFQHKLLVVFALLAAVIIVPILIFVNSAVTTATTLKLEERLRASRTIFSDFLEIQRRAHSDSIGSLVASHPTLRALLGTRDDNDDLFGDQQNQATDGELNSLVASAVTSLDVYRKSALFLVLDGHGRMLFSKADADAFGADLSRIPVIRTALFGSDVATFWGAEDTALANLDIFPEEAGCTMFQVFLRPVIVGNEVKGVVVVGLSIGGAQIAQSREIVQSDVALIHQGILYGSSREIDFDLRKLEATAKEGEIQELASPTEHFVALYAPLRDTLGKRTGVAVVFRSKDRELAFYRRLQTTCSVFALIAGLTGILCSFPISRRVTRSINKLTEGLAQIARGNLETRVTVGGYDEFQALAGAFNDMTKGLREKESIKQTFKRYVNPRVVSALLEEQVGLNLGGDRRELVMYFSDIAGFTTISESLSPEKTIEFLNRYLSRATEIIEASGGIVDKYVGDAIVAYWLKTGEGLPAEVIACETAMKVHEAARALDVHVRIGLHSGSAILGNIGSEHRMEYTIIGDDVNTAARLEALNKEYETSILISESVRVVLGARLPTREIGEVSLRGKANTLRVYALL